MHEDMTRGNIAKKLIAFLGPLIATGMLQQLYGWVDALIVGNFAGEESLAAVGATGSVSNLFINVLIGFSMGISLLTAKAYGEGNNDAIRKTARTFPVFLGVSSLGIIVAALIAIRPLLNLLSTPADILDLSAGYLSVILLGVPVMAVYNAHTAILRGIGDSRTPLYAIVVSSCINVILDLLFVAAFGWGVTGAAVATVISQTCMTVFLVLFCRRKSDAFRSQKGEAPPDPHTLKEGIRLGVPSAIQYAIRSLCSLPLQSVMNSFGTPTIAAVTTAYRIDSVMFLPIVNLDSGVSTFVAQNIGAGDKKRASKGLRVGIVIGLVLAGVLTAILVPCAGWILSLFGITGEAVEIGRRFFLDIAGFYPLFAVLCVYTGYLRGSGGVAFAGIAGTVAAIARVLLSYALAPLMGNRVIAWAEALQWVFQFLLFMGRYLLIRIKARRRRA